ncbi:TolB family protein [Planctomyces sp. SH-PL62]|uniref:TolB family protein n=1 Tax=Planctomyces sp. SH-PL62 TaxID=1636152 RepID=UPI00078D9015|nr:PD40 domain-containing protein [Planctomyces sp. SH-PL62]AMV40970.1 translocation protein TolB [Planctomyces sp. SH-PL62]
MLSFGIFGRSSEVAASCGRVFAIVSLLTAVVASIGCDPGVDSWARFQETKQFDGGAPAVCAAMGTIVFSSPQSGHGDIYSWDEFGYHGLHRLTHDEQFESHPVCSPDGRWIVYSKEEAGYAHLWIMSSDGSGQRQLTSGKFFDYPKGFSGDCASVYFVRIYPSSGMARSADWWHVNLDGTGLVKGGGPQNIPASGSSIDVPGVGTYDFQRYRKMIVQKIGKEPEVVELPPGVTSFAVLDRDRERIVYSSLARGDTFVEIYQVDLKSDKLSRLR